MIFKLTSDNATEFVTGKDHLHVLQSYDKEFDGFHEITDMEEISEDEAKTIMIRNTEYDEDNPDDMPEEISLYDLSCGDDFEIIATTEW